MSMGTASLGEPRAQRLQVMLRLDELRALDNWRFEHRMPSRAAAVRELLKRGLAAEGFSLPGDRRKSEEFGLLSQHDGEDSAA